MNDITYEWFNEEQTVILCTYPPTKWSWNDFFNAFDMQNTMIESVNAAKIIIIVDTRASHWLPKGGTFTSGIKRMTRLKHPRQGDTIIVGAKGLIAAVGRVATKMMGQKQSEIHFVESIEEAENLVESLLSATDFD